MDPEKIEEIIQIGIASIQQSATIQAEDMNETGTEGTHIHMSTKITTTFQSTDDSDEDTIISDTTFGITSERITSYQASPKIIPKIYISTSLESNTEDWEETIGMGGHEDSVTSGNNDVSTPEVVSKSTSGDDISNSKEVILDASQNVKSTASENEHSEESIISTSPDDNTVSTIKETTTVLENITIITTSGDTVCRNMAVDETTVTAIPEISTTPSIAQGDLCNSFVSGETVPVPVTRDTSDITSGKKMINTLSGDSFSVRDTTDTSTTLGPMVDFMETNGTEETSNSGDCATKEDDSTIFPGDFTNSPSPVSSSGENSLRALKEMSFSDPETTMFFSDSGNESLFREDTSAITPVFSAAFQQVPTVVSGTIVSFSSDSDITTVESAKMTDCPTGSPTNGNTTDSVIKEATTNVPTTAVASRNMCTTISLRTPKYAVTTDSGNFADDDDDDDDDDTSTPSLDPVTINENFHIVPRNVSNIISTREITTSDPKGMDTDFESMPTTETLSKPSLSGESTSILSSGEVRETEICKKKAITVPENPIITPSSIHSFDHTNTTEYSATSGSGNYTIEEDGMATTPASTCEIEQSSSPGKVTNFISRDILNTPIKDTFGDTTTVPSFTEGIVIPIPMCTQTIAIQGNKCINMAGNVTTSCGSSIISESVSITLGKNDPYIHKTSTNSFGDYVIPRKDTETVCKDINHSPFDCDIITTASASFQNTTIDVPEYTTTTAFPEDTSGYAAQTKLQKSSETITDKINMTLGNATITHGVSATSDVTHTIPTTVAIAEGAREATTKNAIPILEDNNITAATGAAPTSQSFNGTTSEGHTATATSGDVRSRGTATIHVENDFFTASFTDSENTSVTSSTYRDTISSAREDAVNIASRNVTTLANEELPTTVPNKVPIDHYKANIYPERTNTNLESKDSQITDTFGNATERSITVSINPSEIVISTKEANNTMDSAHRDTTTTAIGKHEIMRIRGDTNHGGNTLLEELITPVPSPASSTDVTPPTSVSSRVQPAHEFMSTHEDNHNEIASCETSSTHSIALKQDVSVASIGGDSNLPSNSTVVSAVFIPNSESAPNIYLFSRELDTDVVEDTTTNTADSLLFDTANSADTSTDTSEKQQYGEGTTTILVCLNSSFSVESSVQEASTEPTAAYKTNISGDAHPEEAFVSVPNKITTTHEQESSFDRTTNSGCTTFETTTQTGRALIEDTSSCSESNNMWSDTSMTPVVVVGSKNDASHGDRQPLHKPVTLGSAVTSINSRISEVTGTPEDVKDNTVTGDIYATEETNIITPFLGTNVSLSNTSRDLTAMTSDKFAETITPLEDVVGLVPVKEATSTVTALKDAVMITQDFPGNIDTHFKHKLSAILHDSPQVRETLPSENIAVYTPGDTEIVIDSEVLTSELMSSAETHTLEDPTDLVSNIISRGTLSNDPSVMTTDTPAASGTISSLSDTIFILNDATSVSEIAMSSEEILSSEIDSTSPFVAINIQNQTPFTGTTTVVPGKIFSTGETVTTTSTSEAETITGDAILANGTENAVTDDINIPNSPEKVTNFTVPGISPIDSDTTASIPLDTSTSTIVLQETEPLEETFSSGNAISVATGDIGGHPDSCIPTLGSTPHEHNGHPFTSNLDTVSTSGDTARILEASDACGNSILPNLFADEIDLTIDGGEASPSKDITSIASEVSTNSGSLNTNKSEGTTLTNAPEYIPITSEAIVLSAGDNASLSDTKCIFMTSLPSGDITTIISEDSTFDLNVPEGTHISAALGDIHATTVIGSGDTTKLMKNSTTPIVGITRNTQYDTSTPSQTRPLGETSASKMADVATRETCGTNFSKTVTKTGKAAAIKGSTIAHTEKPTSAPRDYTYVSDGIPPSRGKVTAMIAIFEDVGKQNENSISRAPFSIAETPVRQANFKSGVNLTYREVTSTNPTPTKFKEGASTVAITRASETATSYSKTKSLRKSDLSMKSTITTTDSVPGAVSCPREMVHISSGSSSEDTLKGISTVETPSGFPEVGISPFTTPFEETCVSDNITVPIDISNKVATTGTEEISISNVNIVVGKYPMSEVKTVPGEIAPIGITSTPRDNFFYGAINSSINTPVSIDVGPLPYFASESTIFPVEMATHGALVSSEEIDTSGDASSSKTVATVDMMSLVTTTNSVNSSEDVTFTPCSGNNLDEAHISGTVITINSETTTALKGAILFEDGAIDASKYENTPELPNIHENATCAPENTFSTVLEVAVADFGSKIIALDDVATTTLLKVSDMATREISDTVGANFIAYSGEKLIDTPREITPEETKASAPRETEIVPRETCTLTLGETATVTSENTDSITTETYTSIEESSATTSVEPSVDASGETNIATFGKIVDPSSTDTSSTPREVGAVSPEESYVSATFRETIDNTRDAHEPSFSVPEELHVDVPREIVVAQPGNITGATTKEIHTDIGEATKVIHRKPSTTISDKNPPTAASGSRFTINPSEIPPTASPIASPALANAPKGNIRIGTTSTLSPMASPRGITSGSQEKNGTIKPVVPPSYWSIMLTGIMVTLILAVGLCMVIYYVTFYILVTYSTS
ncbi:hypothetical protein JD844_013420 [Phrynosoma platyrhinos]|uniref:Uncharacterized protein n=1 Tax=Phrynosoma platyrhinos TaxID=52577 RepID=A0ABQ7TLV6_PHRPL|nr:hypothetical protein JD844_013420 [Phrynosoma platyrhinos]